MLRGRPPKACAPSIRTSIPLRNKDERGDVGMKERGGEEGERKEEIVYMGGKEEITRDK